MAVPSRSIFVVVVSLASTRELLNELRLRVLRRLWREVALLNGPIVATNIDGILSQGSG
jgi:hypothetical protein